MMPVRGFRGRPYADGSVRYGGEAGCSFFCDGALVPRPNARGQAINALKNSQLVETVLQLDRACKRQVERQHVLPEIPELPRILLGFAADELPPFEDSPALRRLAAKELGMPIHRLGTHSSALLERFLEDLWHQQLIQLCRGFCQALAG